MLFYETGPFLIDMVPMAFMVFLIWCAYRIGRNTERSKLAKLDRMRAATEAIQLLNHKRREGHMSAEDVEREMRKSWPNEWALMTADWWKRHPRG